MGKKGLGGRKFCGVHKEGDVLDPTCEDCKLLSAQAYVSSRKSGLFKKLNEFRELANVELVYVYKINGRFGGFLPMGSRNTKRMLKDFLRKLKKRRKVRPMPPIVIGKFADKAVREKAITLPHNETVGKKKAPATKLPIYKLSEECRSEGPVRFKLLKRYTIMV